MFVKNVSYEVLEAVKEDTINTVSFLPQEIKEVSDVDGKWFKERYGDKTVVEVFEGKKEEAVELEPAVEKVVETNTICSICGKVAKTNAGLKVHMKSHS